MLLNLTHISSEPLLNQIAMQIMENKTYECGDPELPSPYSLARQQHLNASEVRKAYQILIKWGIVTHKNGQFFVSQATRPDPETILHQLKDRFSCRTAQKFSDSMLLLPEADIRTARQIQAKLFPPALPRNRFFNGDAWCSPCREVGGDYFDFIRDDQKIAIVIGDACGKGLAAAMIVSQVHAMLHAQLGNGKQPDSMLKILNDHLCNFTPRDKFVTLFLGLFSPDPLELRYVCAGHHHPVVIHPDGRFTTLNTASPALGLSKNVAFKLGIYKPKAGDLMILYTDGITETMNAAGELYGEERMLTLLLKERTKEPKAVVGKLLKDINAFSGKMPLQTPDDRTLMVLRIHEGVEAIPQIHMAELKKNNYSKIREMVR